MDFLICDLLVDLDVLLMLLILIPSKEMEYLKYFKLLYHSCSCFSFFFSKWNIVVLVVSMYS